MQLLAGESHLCSKKHNDKNLLIDVLKLNKQKNIKMLKQILSPNQTVKL